MNPMNPAMCGPAMLPTNVPPYFMGIPTGMRPILSDGRINEMPMAPACPPVPMAWGMHPSAMCAMHNPAIGMHCPPVGLHGSPVNNHAGAAVPWSDAEGLPGSNATDKNLQPPQFNARPPAPGMSPQQIEPNERVDQVKDNGSGQQALKDAPTDSHLQPEPTASQQAESAAKSMPPPNAWAAALKKTEDGERTATRKVAAGDSLEIPLGSTKMQDSQSPELEQALRNEDVTSLQLPSIHLRPEQSFGTREYGNVWGASHGEALEKNGEISAKDLGKGLDNPKGEYNCFLNVIIQSLWQLESFREALLTNSELSLRPDDESEAAAFLRSLAKVFSSLSGSKSGVDVVTEGSNKPPAAANAWASGPPAIVSAPVGNAWGSGGKNLFVVDPTECRKALSSIFMSRKRSQVHEMADASEALNDILETLQLFFEQSGKTDSSDASSNIVLGSFGLKVKEGLRCSTCGYKMQEQSYTRFFHYVPPKLLADVHQQLRDQKLSPEDLLREAYARDTRTCPGCKEGNAMFECSQALFSCPDIFSLVLVWETTSATPDDISLLFHQLPLVLDLSLVYSGVPSGSKYRLRCMVCFYGQHYVLLSYKPRVKQWVQYDDSSVKRVGDWKEVVERCRLGRFQPNVLFYERCT